MKLDAGSINYLTITGPFDTNLSVNSQELIYTGYEGFQKDLLKKLDQTTNYGTWFVSTSKMRTNKLTFDVDNYQGLALTPRYFIGFRYTIGPTLKSAIDDIISNISSSIKFNVESIIVKYYESSVGSVSFKGTYELINDTSYLELKTFHEKLSSNITEQGNGMITELTERLRSAIGLEYLLNVDAGNERKALVIEWMHRIFYIKCEDSKRENLINVADEIVPKYGYQKLKDVSIVKDLHVFPSIGSSLIIYSNPDLENDKSFRSLERTIEFLNSYWQATSSIDKRLFYQINELGRNNHLLKLKDLEKRYNLILDTNEQITLFKSTLFNHKINLSPQEYLIWDCVTEAWKLDDLLVAVSAKSDTLRTMNQSILERVENKQTSKLNYLVFIFTTISFVTIILQIIDFVQQGVNVPNLIRTMTVVFLTMAVLFSVKKLRNWLFG